MNVTGRVCTFLITNLRSDEEACPKIVILTLSHSLVTCFAPITGQKRSPDWENKEEDKEKCPL